MGFHMFHPVLKHKFPWMKMATNSSMYTDLGCTSLVWDFISPFKWIPIPCDMGFDAPLIICHSKKHITRQRHYSHKEHLVVYAMKDATGFPWFDEACFSEAGPPQKRNQTDYLKSGVQFTCSDGHLEESNVISSNAHREIETALHWLFKDRCSVCHICLYGPIDYLHSTLNLNVQICINTIQRTFKSYHNSSITMSVDVVNGSIVSGSEGCGKNAIGLYTYCILNNTHCGGQNKHHDSFKNYLTDFRLTYSTSDCFVITLPSLTSEAVCGSDQFACHNGECVSDVLVLDGTEDCVDGSDETHTLGICTFHNNNTVYTGRFTQCQSCTRDKCVCSQHYFQCTNSGCIPWHLVCDGEIHCSDGLDEVVCDITTDPLYTTSEPNHSSHAIYCNTTNTFIESWRVGDGFPDCGVFGEVLYDLDDIYPVIPQLPWVFNAEDEQIHDSSTDHDIKCELGTLPCKFSITNECFPFTKLCVYDKNEHGRLRQCKNGGHLTNCEFIQCSGLYKCPMSYCLPLRRICDGVVDCPGGEDEGSCNEKPLLCPGFLRCRGGGCVHPVHICDGYIDCLELGEDELYCTKAPCPVGCHCLASSLVCYKVNISHVMAQSLKSVIISGSSGSFPSVNQGEYLINLELTHSSLSQVELHNFKGSANIIWLRLSNNKIRSLKPSCFSLLKHLRELVITDNDIIYTHPYSLYKLALLVQLDMHNSFRTSEMFISLTSLQLLNMSGNIIEELTMTFPNQRNLVIDMVNLGVNAIRLTGTPLQRVHVYADWNYVCCHLNVSECTSGQSLTCLCGHEYQGYAWPIGIALTATSLISAIAKRALPKVAATPASLNKDISSVLMGLYLIFIDLKHVAYSLPGVVVIPGSPQHVMCIIASCLQYTSIGLQCLMDTTVLFSLQQITKHWHRPKSEVVKSIKYLCLVIWLDLIFIVPIWLTIEFAVNGSQLNLGHACSVLIGSKLDLFGSLPAAYIVFIYVMGLISQACLIRCIVQNIKESQISVNTCHVGGSEMDKSRKVLRNLFKRYIPPAILNLPLIISIVSMLVIPEVITQVSFLYAIIAFPLPCVWIIFCSLAEFRSHSNSYRGSVNTS